MSEKQISQMTDDELVAELRELDAFLERARSRPLHEIQNRSTRIAQRLYDQSHEGLTFAEPPEPILCRHCGEPLEEEQDHGGGIVGWSHATGRGGFGYQWWGRPDDTEMRPR